MKSIPISSSLLCFLCYAPSLFAGAHQSRPFASGPAAYQVISSSDPVDPSELSNEEPQPRPQPAKQRKVLSLEGRAVLLHGAARTGNVPLIEQLQLLKSEDPRLDDGFNLAHRAALKGQVNVLHYLQDTGREAFLYEGIALQKKDSAYRFLGDAVKPLTVSDRLSSQLDLELLSQSMYAAESHQVFMQSPTLFWLKATPLVLAILNAQPHAAQALLNRCKLEDLIRNAQVVWLLPPKSGKLFESQVHTPYAHEVGALLWVSAAQQKWDAFELLLQKYSAEIAPSLGPALLYSIAEAGRLPTESWRIFREKIGQDHPRGLEAQSFPAVPLGSGSQEVEAYHEWIRVGDLRALSQSFPDFLQDHEQEPYDRNGFKRVHTTAYHGQANVLKELKARYPDLDLFEKAGTPSRFTEIGNQYVGCTPLDIALVRSKASVADELLSFLTEEPAGSLDPARQEQKNRVIQSFVNPCAAYQNRLPLEWVAEKRWMWGTLEKLLQILPESLILKQNLSTGRNFLHAVAFSGFRLSSLPEKLFKQIPTSMLRAQDLEGRTPQGLKIPNLDTQENRDLHDAIQAGDLTSAWESIQKNKELRLNHHVEGCSVIHTAALFGRLDLLKKIHVEFPELDFFEKTTESSLLSDDRVFCPPAGLTPLNAAIRYTSEEIAIDVLKFYRAQFSDEKLKTSLDSQDLISAASYCKFGLIRQLMGLLDAEEIYATDDQGGRNFLHALFDRYRSDNRVCLQNIQQELSTTLDPLSFLFRDHQGNNPCDLEEKRYQPMHEDWD